MADEQEYRFTSVTPDTAGAAAAGLGVVEAVAKVPARRRRPPGRQGKDRTETYQVEGIDGDPVTVFRNIETGAMEITRDDR